MLRRRWRWIFVCNLLCVSLLLFELKNSVIHPPECIIVDSTDGFRESRKAADHLSDIQTLREINSGLQEFWFRIKSILRSVGSSNELINETNKLDIVRTLAKQEKSIEVLIDLLEERNEETGWSKFTSLEEYIHRKIENLQNPKDCSTARLLICELYNNCGFGCELHRVLQCLLTSITCNRTLMLRSQAWKYEADAWKSLFLPITPNCSVPGTEHSANIDDLLKPELKIVKLPFTIHPLPNFMPQSTSLKLFGDVIQFHKRPFLWWIGQLMKYATRPQLWLREKIEKIKMEIGFQSPIVGIHVRRTDKTSEAAYHNIAEYMEFVEEWYDKYDLKDQRNRGLNNVTSRKLFLATDEPSVIEDARQRYPDYEFLNVKDSSINAGLNKRYSADGLEAVVIDIFLLSQCDHLICTFSSTMCRSAYELMQTTRVDASDDAQSLDDIYFFIPQLGHKLKVLLNHTPEPGSDEIELIAGDEILIAGNHWNGFSKGMNVRTGETGLFPSYKVAEMFFTHDFPI